MSLSGRAVAITGASAGIGRACALRCAAEGMAVVLAARRTDRLTEVAAESRRRGGTAVAVTADVTSMAAMDALVGQAVAEFGRLDAIVCNAGIGYVGAADQTPVTVMQRLMDVNFMGTFHAARAALPIFRRQGGGHLVIVSSIVGKHGMPYLSAYSATKSAQIAFADSLRSELRGHGIHVTVVCPVSTRTEFLEVMQKDYGTPVRALGPQQSADRVADAIVKALERPSPEVYPYGPSRALPLLSAIAPGTTDWIVRRFGRKRP